MTGALLFTRIDASKPLVAGLEDDFVTLDVTHNGRYPGE
jgi:hypothetical protein